MIQKILKTFLALVFVLLTHVSLQSACQTACCETFCSARVQGCLQVDGNQTIGGDLAVTGTVIVGGVPLNNLIGLAGAIGPMGATGATGPAGATGILGAAQFIDTTLQSAVAAGTPFLLSTQVFNNVPSAISSSAGAGGTVITLQAGTYLIDYELSLLNPGSVGIYTGATADVLALDENTIAGSLTATTWIHGRAFHVVPTTSVIAISPQNNM